MKINPASLLSEKEAAFASGVLSGRPVTTAARLAGLSIGSADRYLRRPTVAGYLRASHTHLSRIVAKLDAGPQPRRPRS